MNELEELFDVLNFIIDKRLKENPDGGIKTELSRVRYKKLKRVLKNLEYHMMTREELGKYDMCKNCEHFIPDEITKTYGKCTEPVTKARPVTNFGKSRYVYDTCWRNTAVEGSKR